MTKDLTDAIIDGDNLEQNIHPFSDEEHKKITKEIVANIDKKIIEKKQELKELLSQKAQFIEENIEEHLRQNAPTVADMLPKVMTLFSKRQNGEIKPVPLPWPTITSKLKGGLWPGLHILVGNTGSGKSQWALQAAHYAAKKNWPILYISLELGNSDFIARLLGLETDIAWSKIWHGETQALTKINELKATEKIASLPIRQASVPPYGWSYQNLWPLVENMIENHPQKKSPFVILDFMQLVASPEGLREDLREKIQKTAYAARAVARNLSATILLISSTSREKYAALDGRDKGQPAWEQSASFLVGFGKEAGEIEYAADSVFVLAKEPWPTKEPPKEGSTIHLGIAKLRAGAAGAWFKMQFNGSKFRDINQEKELLNL